MKFTTTSALFVLCLLVGQESSLFAQSEKIIATNSAATKPPHRSRRELKHMLAVSKSAFGPLQVNPTISNRKLQDFGDEAVWQCGFETDDAFDGKQDIQDELFAFADAYQVKSEKFVDEKSWTEVEFPKESLLKLQSKCLDAGGYYVEASDPITCTLKDSSDGGDGVLVHTIFGAADCVANTETCKSVDPVLGDLAAFYELFGGECHYETDETNQRVRALRGKAA